MAWPKEMYPKTTSYALIELFRKLRFRWVVCVLIGFYFLYNFFFGVFYYLNQPFFENETFLNSIYYSFITALTIGFGDITPISGIGKTITVIQGITSTFYYSLIISLLSIKILFPYHSIQFSERICYDGKQFIFRVLNSHRALLINPEIRINVVEHAFGNRLALTVPVKNIDNINWLDNHDFCIGFSEIVDNTFSIVNEWNKALNYQGKENKSRFKIRISISGSYGMQQYAQVKNYDKDDIILGKEFKSISYNDEDKKLIRNIKFSKFGKFWTDFNTIM